MLEEEKRKHEKIDEMKKTINATRLDINEGRRILTTDHLGHPLLIRQEQPDKFPNIIVKSKVKVKTFAFQEGESSSIDDKDATTSLKETTLTSNGFSGPINKQKRKRGLID